VPYRLVVAANLEDFLRKFASRALIEKPKYLLGPGSRAPGRTACLLNLTCNALTVEVVFSVPKSGSGKLGITCLSSGYDSEWRDRAPDLITAVYLLMQWKSGRQSCLKIDLLSGDGVVEFQILGVQKISSIAGEAGEIFKRLAG